MFHTALIFLATIFAGFALLRLSAAGIGLLTGLTPILEIIAVLVILIFIFALFYIGFKTLFNKSWR